MTRIFIYVILFYEGDKLKNLIPNIYNKSIYTIDYNKLKKNNVKCLLYDLDNTCVPYPEKVPTKELTELFNKLTKLGFKVIIFSNTTPNRLENFKSLNIEIHGLSKKPFKKGFLDIINTYKYKKEEICIIGDQIFTDILGGNRVGIKTILVDPMGPHDFIFTKITRMIEKIIFRRMKRKNILTKGVYDE